MKTLILAAALVALSAPVVLAEAPLKHIVADAAAVPDAVKTYVGRTPAIQSSMALGSRSARA